MGRTNWNQQRETILSGDVLALDKLIAEVYLLRDQVVGYKALRKRVQVLQRHAIELERLQRETIRKLGVQRRMRDEQDTSSKTPADAPRAPGP